MRAFTVNEKGQVSSLIKVTKRQLSVGGLRLHVDDEASQLNPKDSFVEHFGIRDDEDGLVLITARHSDWVCRGFTNAIVLWQTGDREIVFMVEDKTSTRESRLLASSDGVALVELGLYGSITATNKDGDITSILGWTGQEITWTDPKDLSKKIDAEYQL